MLTFFDMMELVSFVLWVLGGLFTLAIFVIGLIDFVNRLLLQRTGTATNDQTSNQFNSQITQLPNLPRLDTSTTHPTSIFSTVPNVTFVANPFMTRRSARTIRKSLQPSTADAEICLDLTEN